MLPLVNHTLAQARIITTAVCDEAAKLHQIRREIGFFTVKDFGAFTVVCVIEQNRNYLQ
ncbi:MAG: hypothetical protein ACYC3N_07105 [Halothiobacillus sp.]